MLPAARKGLVSRPADGIWKGTGAAAIKRAYNLTASIT